MRLAHSRSRRCKNGGWQHAMRALASRGVGGSRPHAPPLVSGPGHRRASCSPAQQSTKSFRRASYVWASSSSATAATAARPRVACCSLPSSTLWVVVLPVFGTRRVVRLALCQTVSDCVSVGGPEQHCRNCELVPTQCDGASSSYYPTRRLVTFRYPPSPLPVAACTPMAMLTARHDSRER